MYLPSLRHIAILPCRNLPRSIRETHLAGDELFLADEEIPTRILTYGKSSLQSESKSGTPGGTATLTFHTSEQLDTSEPLAFFAVTHEGATKLIGAWEPPFPEITLISDTGDAPSSTRGVTVTVKWSYLPVPVTFLNP